ncbi:MAG: hypothetical protein K1W39_17390 [Lachnospiraceae bacterium]|jgi:Membrane-bound metallopeptidase
MGLIKNQMMEYWEQDKTELEELQEEIQKIPTVQENIADLESDIESIYDNLQELVDQLKQSEITIEDFNSQIENETDDLQELQEELEESKSELDDLQEKTLRVNELEEAVKKGPFPTIS